MTHADSALALGMSRDPSGAATDDLEWLRAQHPYAKIDRAGDVFTALLGMYRVDGESAAGVSRSLTEHMRGGGLTG